MYDWNNDDGCDIAEEVLSEHHPLSIEKAQTPQAMSIHSSIATFKTSKEGLITSKCNSDNRFPHKLDVIKTCMHTKKSSSSIKSERKDEGEDCIDLTNKCRRSIKVEISDLLKQLVKRKSENYEKHKQSILLK